MSAAEVLTTASVTIAVVAVAVAIWQVRTSATVAERANSLPAMTTVFDEFRSPQFQAHFFRVLNEEPAGDPALGFEGFDGEWQASALQVTYFFQYLGILVAHGLVPKDVVIDATLNRITGAWTTLHPFIEGERARRARTSGPGVSSGFVSHFEHLVTLTVDADGNPADQDIHRRIGLRKVSPQAPGTVIGDGQASHLTSDC